jgi:hypothetical protein
MKNGVFWVVTPCGSCKNRRFGGTHSQKDKREGTLIKIDKLFEYCPFRLKLCIPSSLRPALTVVNVATRSQPDMNMPSIQQRQKVSVHLALLRLVDRDSLRRLSLLADYLNLRHYVASRKVAGSIPEEVNGFYEFTQSVQPH